MMAKKYIDIVSNDSTIKMEVLQTNGEKDVSLKKYKIDDLISAVQDVADKVQSMIKESIDQVNEIQLEFGIGFTVSSGKMLAVLVNGNTEANMKISLCWKKDESS